MAPHDDRSDVAEEAMVAEAEKRPIATIVIIIGSHSRSIVFLVNEEKKETKRENWKLLES